MGPYTKLNLYHIIISFLVLCAKCQSGYKENCNQIWSNGRPIKEVILRTLETPNPGRTPYIIDWQWSQDNVGKWSVYYKEGPRKGKKSGGLMLMSNSKPLAKLSWKIDNGVLIWSSIFKHPFNNSWNTTLCKTNVEIQIKSFKRSFIFGLDNMIMIGGKSGRIKLVETSPFHQEASIHQVLKRKKREQEDLEAEDKKTVWKKIKGWFIELFNRGEMDGRGWLTRLSDWLVGFLERVLS